MCQHSKQAKDLLYYKFNKVLDLENHLKIERYLIANIEDIS